MSAQTLREACWHVPVSVDEVPETGHHIDLAPDAATRDAIAKAVGIDTLPRLEAGFDLTPHGRGGLRVVGRVSATVGQTCVVTLEAVENEVDEAVELVFAPEGEPLPESAAGDQLLGIDDEEPPEPLHEGVVDLAAVTMEFLILGIDPYPRKPGAVFHAPQTEDSATHPFASLAALKKKLNGPSQ